MGSWGEAEEGGSRGKGKRRKRRKGGKRGKRGEGKAPPSLAACAEHVPTSECWEGGRGGEGRGEEAGQGD